MLALALAISALPARSSDQADVQDIAEVFCKSAMSDSMALVEAMLTPDLVDGLSRVRNDVLGSAPAWTRGYFENGKEIAWRTDNRKPLSCTVGAITLGVDVALVEVHYAVGHIDAYYVDILRLQSLSDASSDPWRIADVLHEDGDTMRGEFLRKMSAHGMALEGVLTQTQVE